MMQIAGVTPAFLWLAATAGALSLVTPCVFPMVPLTVSYFLRHSGASRARALSAVCVFGIGVIATFAALGVAVAAFVGAAGLARFAANPWVNLVIAVIFVALALNLLGLYEISAPQSLVARLSGATQRSRSADITSALLMGVLFTLTSFTCTAPFIGTLLVAASQGEWQRPVAGMLVYATVFASPFILLAIIPRWVAHFPRGGAWLGRIKAVMGFIELAAAFKFMSNADLVWHWNVFTHDAVLTTWIVLSLATTFYLLGAFRLPHEPPEGAAGAARYPRHSRENGNPHTESEAGLLLMQVGKARMLAALVFLAFGMWLVTGITGRPLGTLESFLPPVDGAPPAVNPADVPAELHWRLDNLPAALALARQQNRNVFIDFSGYTCTNCRWMEANMFTRPEIKAGLNKFVLARLYTDGDGDIYDRQQALQQRQFGTIALPLYAIVRPDGTTIATLAGLTRSPNAFLDFLRNGRSN